jgi:hypothetical protein
VSTTTRTPRITTVPWLAPHLASPSAGGIKTPGQALGSLLPSLAASRDLAISLCRRRQPCTCDSGVDTTEPPHHRGRAVLLGASFVPCPPLISSSPIGSARPATVTTGPMSPTHQAAPLCPRPHATLKPPVRTQPKARTFPSVPVGFSSLRADAALSLARSAATNAPPRPPSRTASHVAATSSPPCSPPCDPAANPRTRHRDLHRASTSRRLRRVDGDHGAEPVRALPRQAAGELRNSKASTFVVPFFACPTVERLHPEHAHPRPTRTLARPLAGTRPEDAAYTADAHWAHTRACRGISASRHHTRH